MATILFILFIKIALRPDDTSREERRKKISDPKYQLYCKDTHACNTAKAFQSGNIDTVTADQLINLRPAKKDASPAKKDVSPAKKDASPAKKDASPAKKDASPAKKDATPAKANPSTGFTGTVVYVSKNGNGAVFDKLERGKGVTTTYRFSLDCCKDFPGNPPRFPEKGEVVQFTKCTSTNKATNESEERCSNVFFVQPSSQPKTAAHPFQRKASPPPYQRNNSPPVAHVNSSPPKPPEDEDEDEDERSVLELYTFLKTLDMTSKNKKTYAADLVHKHGIPSTKRLKKDFDKNKLNNFLESIASGDADEIRAALEKMVGDTEGSPPVTPIRKSPPPRSNSSSPIPSSPGENPLIGTIVLGTSGKNQLVEAHDGTKLRYYSNKCIGFPDNRSPNVGEKVAYNTKTIQSASGESYDMCNNVWFKEDQTPNSKRKAAEFPGTIVNIVNGIRGYVHTGQLKADKEKINYGFLFSKCKGWPKGMKPQLGELVRVQLETLPSGIQVCSAVYFQSIENKAKHLRNLIYNNSDGDLDLHFDTSKDTFKDLDVEELSKEIRQMTLDENASRAIRIKQHVDLMTRSASADVVFLLDCTGSMEKYIDAAKDGIGAIQRSISNNVSNFATIRFAFVGYRDFDTPDIPSNPYPFLNFTKDVKAFEKYVGGVKANGGDDACEDVHGGLEKCTGLNWSENANNRMIFHIADAPCHGRFFSDGMSDEEYKRYDFDGKDKFDNKGEPMPDTRNHQIIDPQGLEAQALLKSLMIDSKVQYIFCEIPNALGKIITRPMITVFNRLLHNALKSEPNSATPELLNSIQIITKPLANAADIVKVAETSVTDSISRSSDIASSVLSNQGKSSSSNLRKKVVQLVKDYGLAPTEEGSEEDDERVSDGAVREGIASGRSTPTNQSDSEVESKQLQQPPPDGAQLVNVKRLEAPPNIESLCAGPAEPYRKGGKGGSTKRWMKVYDAEQDMVIGAGSTRRVYRATEYIDGNQKPLVLKVALNETSLEEEKKNAMQEMQCQTAAAFLAKKFTEALKAKGSKKVLQYLKAKVVKFTTSSGKVRWAGVENILTQAGSTGEVEFEKWSNNAGFVGNVEVMQAFSHWSHHITKGQMMVTDLQGLEVDSNSFVLTDPAIHCTDPSRFSASTTNWGEVGMKLFLDKHECKDNYFCKLLGLEKDVSMSAEEEEVDDDEEGGVLGAMKKKSGK